MDHPGIAICHESPVNRQISIVGASNREGKMGTRMISTHSNQNWVVDVATWCVSPVVYHTVQAHHVTAQWHIASCYQLYHFLVIYVPLATSSNNPHHRQTFHIMVKGLPICICMRLSPEIYNITHSYCYGVLCDRGFIYVWLSLTPYERPMSCDVCAIEAPNKLLVKVISAILI